MLNYQFSCSSINNNLIQSRSNAYEQLKRSALTILSVLYKNNFASIPFNVFLQILHDSGCFLMKVSAYTYHRYKLIKFISI